MKDYSEVFKHPESYITSININQKQGLIFVKFSNGRIFDYPLTQENLEKYMNILNRQYTEINKDNQKIIKEKYNDGPILPGSILVGLIGFIASTVAKNPALSNVFLSWFIIFTAYGSINSIIKNINIKNIKTRMDFINKKEELVEVAEEDLNIMKNTSNETVTILKEQKSLKNADLIDDEYNILFVDKAKLKDLKEWLINYEIAKGLSEPVEVKKRTRRK